MTVDPELGPGWRPAGTASGFSYWPNLTHTYVGATHEPRGCRLDIHPSHYADAEMATSRLPGTPAETVAEPLHPPAISRSFRFGPVVGFVRVSGPPPIAALAAMVRSAAERQEARVRRMIAADAVLEVDAPTPDQVAATTAHISPRRSRSAPTDPSTPSVPVGRISTWRLKLADCRAIHDEDDVRRTFERIAELCLVPSLGPWTAGHTPVLVTDIPAWMRHVHQESAVWRRWKATARKLSRTNGTEHWSSTALGPGLGWRPGGLSIERYGRDNWHVSMSASAFLHDADGLPLEDHVASWAVLLERITEDLRPRLDPALTMLYATDSYTDLTEDLERGALLVGWRTWFGPRLVERFGREFLLGLPDQTETLADGSIAHRLRLSPLEVVQWRAGKYANLRRYLQDAAVDVAWPRLRLSTGLVRVDQPLARRRGHRAIHAGRDLGFASRPDTFHIQESRRRREVLVTWNHREFKQEFLRLRHHPGMVVFDPGHAEPRTPFPLRRRYARSVPYLPDRCEATAAS